MSHQILTTVNVFQPENIKLMHLANLVEKLYYVCLL